MGKLTITGTGKTAAVADTAYFNVAVRTFAKKSLLARKENNEAANKVVAILEASGIAEKDRKSIGLNVWPDFEGTKKTKLKGYYVQHSLSVCVRDLDKADEIIDNVAALGDSIIISNLAFDVEESKKEELLNEARKLAVKDALAKATLYCKEAGVGLGPLDELSEYSHGNHHRYGAVRAMAGLEAAGAAPDGRSNVQAGESEVEIQINAVFKVGTEYEKN